jgi:hypothetical protein
MTPELAKRIVCLPSLLFSLDLARIAHRIRHEPSYGAKQPGQSGVTVSVQFVIFGLLPGMSTECTSSPNLAAGLHGHYFSGRMEYTSPTRDISKGPGRVQIFHSHTHRHPSSSQPHHPQQQSEPSIKSEERCAFAHTSLGIVER